MYQGIDVNYGLPENKEIVSPRSSIKLLEMLVLSQSSSQ